MKLYHTIGGLLFFCLFSAGANAQSFVSLSSGVSADLNNPNHSFHHIPFSLMWKPLKQKNSSLFIELDYDIPLPGKASGDAYTLNPALPQKVTLDENILPYIFTGSVGFSIHLLTIKDNNSFYLNILPIGICNQNIKVSYKNFDSQNYEVLNPDVNSSETGFVMSIAPAYYFHKTKQDMMIMLHLQTPLLKGNRDYLLSSKYIAPMQLTFGYNFYYNK
jgi:hypothetical protein